MHILVVEDQQVDRFIFKKMLQPYYPVTTLSSAKEAVAFATTHSFEVALLNVMLARDLDSIDLLFQLRKTNPFFKAIAITCHIDDVRYRKLLDAGFLGVLKKPFELQAFGRLIQNNHEETPMFRKHVA